MTKIALTYIYEPHLQGSHDVTLTVIVYTPHNKASSRLCVWWNYTTPYEKSVIKQEVQKVLDGQVDVLDAYHRLQLLGFVMDWNYTFLWEMIEDDRRYS